MSPDFVGGLFVASAIAVSLLAAYRLIKEFVTDVATDAAHAAAKEEIQLQKQLDKHNEETTNNG